MKKVYVTRAIPEVGIALLEEHGCEVDISSKDGVLTKSELISELQNKSYDAVLSLLTDNVNSEVFDAVPSAKIFANYAVGFNNIDIEEADKRGITVTNTPGVLTDTVAEHTVALMLTITSRTVEGDWFVRAGKFEGWAPMLLLGTDLKGKTLGILGAGRIGQRVAHIASRGLGMNICYFDVKQNEEFEKEYDAVFKASVQDVCKTADVVTVHVPLLDSTKHLINKEMLSVMKNTAYLVNSSRGQVIKESALVEALKNGSIRGAALDVFEDEPKLAPGLTDLKNVVITPHIASATEETRGKMAEIASKNIIDFFDGKTPDNVVKK
jgi:glyoxylate reductase|tara:strand:- start:45587 stop:46558 length:972 start_codon:yes stop_codon:yes gene_type:complete